MKKYNLIILSDRQKGPLFEKYGYANKALLPIHGRPMLDWVIEAFNGCQYIENMVVVGDEELDKTASMRYVRQRIAPGINVAQSLLHAIAYFKLVIHNNVDNHRGYLITFSDAVFLTPKILDMAIRDITESNADVVLHYVEKEFFKRSPFTLNRAYVPIERKHYAGTCLYYVRKFNQILGLLEKLDAMRKNRKDPIGLLKALGCEGKNLIEIEATLSSRLSAKVRMITGTYPELGMDIDQPEDFVFAEKYLKSPWRHPYKKARMIFNPKSGEGMQLAPFFKDILGIKRRKFEICESKYAYIDKIQEYLRKYGISADVVATQSAGHATEIAQDAVRGAYDLVIAVGGDGTINEVINGLVGSDVTLGVIPLGTANVFGIEMKLPIEIEAACQVIASGKIIKIDLGKSNDRYFACMAGIGYDAHVLREADSELKKIYGALAYLIVGLSHILTYRFRQIILKIDDQPIARRGYFVVIGNGKYYGGDMMFASKADLTDGYLDVCIFKHKNILSIFNYLFGFHKGNIDRHLDIEYFQCKRIDVLNKGRHPVHVDAEYLCRTPVTFQVCPGALKVAV